MYYANSLRLRQSLSIALAGFLLMIPMFPGSTEAAARGHRSFNGEELYRGLVLWQGEVADLVPEIRQLRRMFPQLETPDDPEYAAAIAHFGDQLVAELYIADPTFFSVFERGMRSGNPLRVQEALRRAGVATFEAISNMPELKEGLDRLLLGSEEGRARLATAGSELLEADISVADVDRMLREIAAGSASAPLNLLCIVLNVFFVINAAAYLNVAAVQNVAVAVAVAVYAAVYVEVELPEAKLLDFPGGSDGEGSLAFGKRLNAGRLAAERLVSRVAREFADS